MQLHVIKSLVRKELSSYFTNPTGYAFITLFVFLSGLAAFWTPAFFERNLANLDQLNDWFGVLLILLIPAITMGAWAQERQQGTDELLLTMPATELELVLGKYFGCVSIYFICLVFAAFHVVVLSFLGRPDVGVMLSTYFAYFLAGSGLIGIGLAASTLSSSATISYIAGALSCGVLVLIGLVERVKPQSTMGELATAISVPRHLETLVRGVVDFTDVFYFVAIAAMGIAAAVLIVSGRRRMGSSIGGGSRWLHMPVRALALIVILISAVILLDRTALRVDASSERLWSVSPQTRRVINELPAGRTIAVTAYVSPKVPQSYVQQRETLLGVLAEYQALSGGKVQTRVINTEPNTPEAREAEKSFGIRPRELPADSGGMGASQPVYLGITISGAGGVAGTEASTVEFLSRGLSPEYELTRAIRAASATVRKRVGILDTPAGLYGQFDFQTMQPGQDWQIVGELKKQYEVARVSPAAEYPTDLDVLVVAQPSSMRAEEVNRLAAYVKTGKPVLIFDDPFPSFNSQLAIAEPNRPANPMARGQPPEPKGDMRPLHEALGARVVGDAVLWDPANPHPLLATVPPPILFLSRATGGGKGDQAIFNDADPVVGGLQECVIIFGGRIERFAPPAAAGAVPVASQPSFVSLIRSGPGARNVPYASLIQRNMFGIGINRDARPVGAAAVATIAARLSGGENKINAILVGDLDIAGREFFAIREQGNVDLDFDNVTFVLNAIDSLAGDDSLVELRKRRREFRTLDRVERVRQELADATHKSAETAEDAAKAQLAEAQKRFETTLKEIEAKTDLDENTKRIMIESSRESEQRRLDAQTAAIEDQKRQTIDDQRVKTRTQIENIQMTIRVLAVALPPIPALAIGALVFIRRRTRETAVHETLDPASK